MSFELIPFLYIYLVKIKFTILFLLLLHPAIAQNYFNNIYEQPGYNMANDVAEVDSNYYVIGQNINTINRLIKCYKLNFAGDTIWVKNYEVGNKVFYTQKIMDVSTGLYVFGSYRDSAYIDSSDFFLAKFSYNFDLEWFKNYGGEFFEGAMDMIRTQDNGLLLSGSSVGVVAGPENFFVVKTDSLGNEEWNRRYPYDWYSRIANVVQLNDGTFMASGTVFVPPTPDFWGNYDFMLLKFDEDGDELWRKMFGTIKDEDALFVSKLNDHSLLINGSSQNTNNLNFRGYISKIDYEGNEIWSKYISEYMTMFYNSKPLIESDNSFLIPARVSNTSFETFAVLYKYNPIGELLWFREYKDSTYPRSKILSISNDFNNGYIMVGHAFDSLNIQTAWVVKTDCFGCDSILCYYPDSVCAEYDCNLYPINANFTIDDAIINLANAGEDTVTFVNPFGNTTNRVWNFGDDSLSYTDSVVQHEYDQIGTYQVQLIVYHGMCSDTLTQTVEVVNVSGLSSSLEGGSRRVTIAPNPNNGSFTIVSPFLNDVEISLLDAQGKFVYHNSIKNGKNEFQLNLSPGLYILECGILRERLIIR